MFILPSLSVNIVSVPPVNFNLKNNENAISVKNEKKTVVASGRTVRNERFNDKGKNVNCLLKRECEVEETVFVDNSNVT